MIHSGSIAPQMNQGLKTSDRLRSISQLFTSATVRRVTAGDTGRVLRRIRRHNAGANGTSVRKALNRFYAELDAHYRNEYLFKNALLNDELLAKHSLSTTTVLNEFRLGGSIADFVLLNGEIRAFEIKTDLDNLSKLEKQIQDYRRVANKIFLVVSDENARRLLPRYEHTSLGVIGYSNRTTLTTYKEADDDCSGLQHEALFKTLRQSEYQALVMRACGYLPSVPNTKIFRECLAIARSMPVVELQAEVRELLKRRALRCPQGLTSRKTPPSLRHICYTLNLTKLEYYRLHEFLSIAA